MRLLIALLVCSFSASANLVVPNGPWQSLNNNMATGSVITSNNAYWNGDSSDYSGCGNIGCYVTQQGAFSDAPQFANPVWLGNNDGSAAKINPGDTSPGFYFTADPGNSPVSLLFEKAGQSGTNWFGWYNLGSDFTEGNYGASWGVIFDGNDAATKLVTFNPGSQFGFWFAPDFSNSSRNSGVANLGTGGSITNDTKTKLSQALRGVDLDLDANSKYGDDDTAAVFTQAALNKGFSTSNQYFSLFSDQSMLQNPPTTFILGMEDRDAFYGSSDRDYNDMIVSMKLSPVPEPGFYGVLSLGLASLYLVARRKKA